MLGGVWQYTKPGASGEEPDIMPVFGAVEKPENGSYAAEKMSGGWVDCGKSCSIMDGCDHPSEG